MTFHLSLFEICLASTRLPLSPSSVETKSNTIYYGSEVRATSYSALQCSESPAGLPHQVKKEVLNRAVKSRYMAIAEREVAASRAADKVRV